MTSLTEVPGEPSSAVTGPGGSLSDQLDGAHVAVVGLGRTGRAVVDALATLGARIHVFDSRESSVEMLQTPVASTTVADAEATAAALAQSPARLLIVSPGVPATGPVLRGAAAAGIETWSEVELAWRIQQDSARPHVPWLTLTGTDGKTTTVSMLSAILEAQGLTAPAVGNIGTPVIEAVLAGSADALAVELSSFQLHTTRTLAPLASACLNLAADHLDWHGGLEAYAQDKARVYSHTRLAAVYNLADAATEDMVRQADVVEGCRAVGFTLAAPGLGQVGMVEDLLVDRAFHAERRSSGIELATTADLAHLAPGRRAQNLPAHLLADALAAAALHVRTAVERHDVSGSQLIVTGDAVNDHIVHRDAHRRRIAVVALEVRGRSPVGNRLGADLVQLTRRNAGANSAAQGLVDRRDDQASLAHPPQLLDGLELDVRHRLLRHRIQDREDTGRDIVDAAAPIHDLEHVLVHVVSRHGLGLLVVDLQAVTHDGLSVIRAVLLLSALEHALHDLVLVHLDLQDDVNGLAQIEEHVAQDVRLLHGTRVAVEEETVGSVGGCEARLHHGVRDRVRNELTAVHVGLRLLANLRTFRHVGTEDVARRNSRNTEALSDARGLGALASSGRAEEDDDCHFRNPS